MARRSWRGPGFARKDHLFNDVQGQRPEEMRHSCRVVGDPQFYGSDGEGRLGCADCEVAGHGQVTGRSPDAAVKHGDHWNTAVPNATEDSFKSCRPSYSVLAVEWYFANVVAGRPDLGIWIRTDDDDADTLILKLVEGLEQIIANVAAERINWRIADGRDPKNDSSSLLTQDLH